MTASVWPVALDNLPTNHQTDEFIQADYVNWVNDCVNKMQQDLAPGARGTYASVKARLDAIAAALAAVPFLSVTTQAADYTIVATDNVIVGNPAAGTSIRLTLPTAAGVTGKLYRVKRLAPEGVGTGVQVAAPAGQPIDTTQMLYSLAAYEAISLISDGTRWLIV